MTIDLRYGDTIEQMKLIPDKSIDSICCDLPYGTTACVWDIIIPFDKLWEQYKRIIKDKVPGRADRRSPRQASGASHRRRPSRRAAR